MNVFAELEDFAVVFLVGDWVAPSLLVDFAEKAVRFKPRPSIFEIPQPFECFFAKVLGRFDRGSLKLNFTLCSKGFEAEAEEAFWKLL